ncbi:MAG: group II intron reverse transcriptase/maturase [Symploca sp. SIO2E6]|nr:group II intron reverse transcriptase/maturase [Symploca sp. SIO2E6]
MNTATPMYEWNQLPWHKLEREVFKLQKRIYQASNCGNVKLVRRLQKLLMKSWAAKCLAVRRVSQNNQGKKTAGVDGVKSLTPKQRLTLINNLELGTKVKPTRRVWIPKPGKEEKRPLGIPTMNDRALQALVKLALEPEWEAQFEPNSYGFRPGRSCQDAIEAIYIAINQKAKYVLDADIAKCFDNIDHKRLLRKLNTSPTIRRQIRAWLKAGVMDDGQFSDTSEGTPQGGVISPLLANIALHGMEWRIKEYVETCDLKRSDGKYQLPKRDKRDSVQIIRYADDFVILHKDVTVVQGCREIISEWLNDIGLELKPSKTRLVHTLKEHEGQKAGFDFLGFHVQQFRVGKYATGRDKKGIPLGFKTLITPSQEKCKTHYEQIKKVVKTHKGTSQKRLIEKLNPIIRGWANYYSTVCSTKAFSKMDAQIYTLLESWAKHRHRNKGKKWLAKRYWKTIGGNNWVFATREGDFPIRLLKHSATKTQYYVKVKGDASPYDGNLVYWSIRMGKNPEMPKRTASLLKKQKGKCTHCGYYFKDGDVIELDHIIPKSLGGKDEYKNWQLLHRHCHDTKTALDGSYGTQSGCNSAEPKPPVIPGWHWIDDMLVTRCV